MATRLYSIAPGQTEFQIVENVGSATVHQAIELTVDLSTSIVTDDGTTRAVLKEEVLQALDMLKNHILTGKWLPA